MKTCCDLFLEPSYQDDSNDDLKDLYKKLSPSYPFYPCLSGALESARLLCNSLTKYTVDNLS